MNYDWNFGRLAPYVHAFIQGTFTTISLTVFVIILGTVLGIAVGMLIRNRFAALVVYPILDAVRAVPPLVFILFMYYLLTINVIGYTVDAYWVYVIAMSLNLAAFTADFVRSSAETINVKALESGKALGMTDAQVTRHIFFPHLIRSLVPAMTALYIGMLKMSSLASVINVAEIVYTAQNVIADIARSLEAWVIVAAVYIAIVLPTTYLLRYFERRVRSGWPTTVIA